MERRVHNIMTLSPCLCKPKSPPLPHFALIENMFSLSLCLCTVIWYNLFSRGQSGNYSLSLQAPLLASACLICPVQDAKVKITFESQCILKLITFFIDFFSVNVYILTKFDVTENDIIYYHARGSCCASFIMCYIYHRHWLSVLVTTTNMHLCL